jgi:hypothetical protein
MTENRGLNEVVYCKPQALRVDVLGRLAMIKCRVGHVMLVDSSGLV